MQRRPDPSDAEREDAAQGIIMVRARKASTEKQTEKVLPGCRKKCILAIFDKKSEPVYRNIHKLCEECLRRLEPGWEINYDDTGMDGFRHRAWEHRSKKIEEKGDLLWLEFLISSDLMARLHG